MLDVGFSELLLIAIVALVVIGPKDLPVVIRHVMKFVRELRGLYAGIKHQMHQVMEEAGLHDLHQDMTTIIDLEGKPQQAYNVDDLKLLESKTPAVPPPIGAWSEKKSDQRHSFSSPRLGGGHREGDGVSPTSTEQVMPPPQPHPYGGGSKP